VNEAQLFWQRKYILNQRWGRLALFNEPGDICATPKLGFFKCCSAFAVSQSHIRACSDLRGKGVIQQYKNMKQFPTSISAMDRKFLFAAQWRADEFVTLSVKST
jgi:hypothetical protein